MLFFAHQQRRPASHKTEETNLTKLVSLFSQGFLTPLESSQKLTLLFQSMITIPHSAVVQCVKNIGSLFSATSL